MLTEREIESCYLGQFIPLQYHHNMLMDSNRMKNFKAAIAHAVFPGAKVLELGGGTGVLSWFAAANAEKVWCVEYNPELVAESRRLLALNKNGHKVEVVHADAFEYLPPEPVDVVICEMIHVAMLKEKQIEMIESFKRRYLERFGGPLPIFIPEAVIMAAQPIQQEYDFEGFNAPIMQIQELAIDLPDTVELARPAVYSILDFNQTMGLDINWEGVFMVERSGTVNAMRFITKNVLAVVMENATTIDWLNRYLALPLNEPVTVKAGDALHVQLSYRAGGQIQSLQASIRAKLLHNSVSENEEQQRVAYA